MGRLTNLAEQRREDAENIMALIGHARLLLRSQVTLRVRQAAQRGNAELLDPALEQINDVDQVLSRAQAYIGETWRAGAMAGK